jgi:hypothetical protein
MKKDIASTAIYIAFEDYEAFDGSHPEKNLLRAVLLSAMNDLNKGGDAGRKAREYFLNADEDYLFSFNSVCSYLNVDPDKILYVTGLRKPRSGFARAPQTQAAADQSES